MMIADMHAHYPMHLVPADRGSPLDAIRNFTNSGFSVWRNFTRLELRPSDSAAQHLP